jgi:hypothetical protein
MSVCITVESSILAFSAARALERHRVSTVDPFLLLELLREPVDDALVEVVAAQVRRRWST